jgi:hypothetical protein
MLQNGVTPLHVASHYDHQNVALLLLDKGASPHATAKNGHTPLHIAARKNQVSFVRAKSNYILRSTVLFTFCKNLFCFHHIIKILVVYSMRTFYISFIYLRFPQITLPLICYYAVCSSGLSWNYNFTECACCVTLLGTVEVATQVSVPYIYCCVLMMHIPAWEKHIIDNS